MDFVLLVLKLYPIQIIISFPFWIKLIMVQLMLFFLCNFSSFFSYVGVILVSNLISLLLIDIFWLFIILWHTRSICKNLFDLQRSSELPQKCWHRSRNKRKWLKQPQSHFREAKATIFCCFDVFSVRPPQIFHVQTKISTKRPVFPDYLSVSYDYIVIVGSS